MPFRYADLGEMLSLGDSAARKGWGWGRLPTRRQVPNAGGRLPTRRHMSATCRQRPTSNGSAVATSSASTTPRARARGQGAQELAENPAHGPGRRRLSRWG